MPPKAKAAPAGKSAAKSSWENELVQVILSRTFNTSFFEKIKIMNFKNIRPNNFQLKNLSYCRILDTGD